MKGTSFYDVKREHYRAPDLGDRINKALTAIEDANKRKLDGVFRAVDFNGETEERSRLRRRRDRRTRRPRPAEEEPHAAAPHR